MTVRNEACIIFGRERSFPYQLRYEVLPTKYFVTTFFEVFLLIVINADKDNTIIC